MVELEKRPDEEMFIPGGGYTKILYEKWYNFCIFKELCFKIIAIFSFAVWLKTFLWQL